MNYIMFIKKYEEKKDDLDKKKDTKKFGYTKLRVTDYLYESEEEEEQTDKKPGKKNYLKTNRK